MKVAQSCPTLCNPTDYTWTVKQTLGGHKQNRLCTRTQEKGAVTPQKTDPDLPKSVQESPAKAWSAVAGCRAGGAECSSASWALLKEVAIIFITSTIVCPQVNSREGTQLYLSIKIALKIY